MTRTVPNGAYRTQVAAKRAGIKHPDCGNQFVVYATKFGYGWANVGSAAYDDLVAGHDEGEPAILCELVVRTSAPVSR